MSGGVISILCVIKQQWYNKNPLPDEGSHVFLRTQFSGGSSDLNISK